MLSSFSFKREKAVRSDLWRVLHTGLRAPKERPGERVIHCPLIAIQPLPSHSQQLLNCQMELEKATHVVFTSQTAVEEFFSKWGCLVREKIFLAIGQATASAIHRLGYQVSAIADESTSEGVVELLRGIDLNRAHLLWPHSAQSREVIDIYLQNSGISFASCVLYDVVPKIPKSLPEITSFDEVAFTSPSTVKAFRNLYHHFTPGVVYQPIGRVTRAYLLQAMMHASSSGYAQVEGRERREGRMNKITVHAVVSGKVQGVFFRDTTRRKAKEAGVTGWVRNLPTGDVELVASGDEAVVTELIEWLWQGSKLSHVISVSSETVDYQPFDAFTVRR